MVERSPTLTDADTTAIQRGGESQHIFFAPRLLRNQSWISLGTPALCPGSRLVQQPCRRVHDAG